MWVSDKHKIAVSGGEMKLRKRKSSEVPDTVITAYQGVPGNASLTYTQAKNAIEKLKGKSKSIDSKTY